MSVFSIRVEPTFTDLSEGLAVGGSRACLLAEEEVRLDSAGLFRLGAGDSLSVGLLIRVSLMLDFCPTNFKGSLVLEITADVLPPPPGGPALTVLVTEDSPDWLWWW